MGQTMGCALSTLGSRHRWQSVVRTECINLSKYESFKYFSNCFFIRDCSDICIVFHHNNRRHCSMADFVFWFCGHVSTHYNKVSSLYTHVEHLTNDEHEPLLGEAAHVEARLAREGDLQLLLEVALLVSDLPEWKREGDGNALLIRLVCGVYSEV